MTTLAQLLDEYIQIRRGLGYQLAREPHLITQFIDFLAQAGSDHITSPLAIRWAIASPGGSADSAHNRLRMVRGFAKYVAAQDPRTEMPPYECLPAAPSARTTPYIYTEAEITQLIGTARALSRLKGQTYATLLGLLAATGMRVGEAIGLNRDDIDSRRGLLIVRQAKFRRARELVLHPTSIEALDAYAKQRDRAQPHPSSPSFLLSLAGTRLQYKNVHFTFLRLLQRADLAERQPRPRIHDLRHTFAVTTLTRWYREGIDVNAKLPALSTYLGHVAPESTYWYLTATPELLQLAKHRAERWLS